MLPAVGIFGTGAGLNLVSSELVPPKWPQRIKPMADPGLTAATWRMINFRGVILLYVRLGDLGIPVWFGVVTGLAVSVSLRTTLIATFATGIFRPERKVVPQHSKPVDILRRAPPARIVMITYDT